MPFLIMFAGGILFYFLCSFWWSIVLVCFLAAFGFYKNGRSAFIGGFLVNSLIWTFAILVKTIPNDNLLATKMATVLHLSRWIWTLFITILIGGIVSGLGGFAGYLTRDSVRFVRKKS